MNAEHVCPGPYYQLPPFSLSRSEHELRWVNQCAWELKSNASVLHPRVSESDPPNQWGILPNAACLPSSVKLGESLPGRNAYNSKTDELFNGPHLMSSSGDAVERTVSTSNSSLTDSATSSNMEKTSSLDDVFRSVVEEIDDQMLDKFFRPALEDEGKPSTGFFPLSAPARDAPSGPAEVCLPTQESYEPADRLFQRFDCVPRPCGAQPIDASLSFFDRLNKEIATAFTNRSRGLITAMRRICELLAQPRSDRLEAVFVRLLNKTFDEMEKATRVTRCTRRPSKRIDEAEVACKPQNTRKKRPVSDMQRHCSNRIPVREDLTSTYSCPRFTDVGLIHVEKRRQNESLTQQNHLRPESLVALENTVPDLMNSFFS